MVTKEDKEEQPLAPGVDKERSPSPAPSPPRAVSPPPQQKEEVVPDDPFGFATPQAPPQEPVPAVDDPFGFGGFDSPAPQAAEEKSEIDDLLGLGIPEASQPSSSTTPLDIFGGSSTDFLDMADMDSEISKLNLDDINVDDIDLDDEKLFD